MCIEVEFNHRNVYKLEKILDEYSFDIYGQKVKLTTILDAELLHYSKDYKSTITDLYSLKHELKNSIQLDDATINDIYSSVLNKELLEVDLKYVDGVKKH